MFGFGDWGIFRLYDMDIALYINLAWETGSGPVNLS